MPHIEVLPHTGPGAAAPAPGWAYVPDTGYDPSKAAINPAARKRNAARQDPTSSSDLSGRQQTQLHKRLAELDRDNQRDVPIPTRKDGSGVTPREKAGRKMTTAVRKILTSGRTFAHWLADEEALAAQRSGALSSSIAATASPAPAPSSTPVTAAQHRVTKTKGSRAPASRSSSTGSSRAKRGSLASKAAVSAATASAAAAAAASPSPATPSTPTAATAAQTPTLAPQQQQPPAGADIVLPDAPPPDDDDEPLLRPSVLAVPAADEIKALLAQPHLAYSAARVGPPDERAGPRRQFCEICGYWGRVKCLRCTARVCGLECKRAHDETSCLRF